MTKDGGRRVVEGVTAGVSEGGIRGGKEFGGEDVTGVGEEFRRAGHWQREIGSGIYNASGGCWGFLARRARISVDILGLGTTSRQGGWFWVVS